MNRTEQQRMEEFKKLLQPYCTENLIVWLYKNEYFKAPASKSHHGNTEGGLFEHSHMVALILRELTDNLKIKWSRNQSPEMIGLLHDLCKMDEYIKVKEYPCITHYEDGREEVEESKGYTYDYNPKQLIKGHGDKSAILALSKIFLTDEEILCIRYHMGAFAGQQEWKNYSEAVSRYPNILWVNYADMLASQYFNI